MYFSSFKGCKKKDSDGYSRTETEYTATIEYSFEGKTYTEEETGDWSPNQGEIVKINVDPKNPEDARLKGELTYMPWLILGLGVVGSGASFYSLKKKKYS